MFLFFFLANKKNNFNSNSVIYVFYLATERLVNDYAD